MTASQQVKKRRKGTDMQNIQSILEKRRGTTGGMERGCLYYNWKKPIFCDGIEKLDLFLSLFFFTFGAAAIPPPPPFSPFPPPLTSPIFIAYEIKRKKHDWIICTSPFPQKERTNCKKRHFFPPSPPFKKRSKVKF